MEDALVHIPTEYIEDIVGLNPCFNGRCTSTLKRVLNIYL